MTFLGLTYVGTQNEIVRFESGKKFETGETVEVYVAPDHTRGTLDFFEREASKGRLHGCIVSF